MRSPQAITNEHSYHHERAICHRHRRLIVLWPRTRGLSPSSFHRCCLAINSLRLPTLLPLHMRPRSSAPVPCAQSRIKRTLFGVLHRPPSFNPTIETLHPVTEQLYDNEMGAGGMHIGWENATTPNGHIGCVSVPDRAGAGRLLAESEKTRQYLDPGIECCKRGRSNLPEANIELGYRDNRMKSQLSIEKGVKGV